MYMKQKSLFLIFNVLVIGMLVMAATPNDSSAIEKSPVKEVESVDKLVGFKDWKQKRVFMARAALDQFKSQQVDPNANKGSQESTKPEEASEKSQAPVEPTKSEVAAEVPSAVSTDPKAGETLRQLEFNLEIALGLTIHDYFALYLKDKNKEDMVSAIQKLSPDELSELLMAYRKSLYGLPKQPEAQQSPEAQKL